VRYVHQQFLERGLFCTEQLQRRQRRRTALDAALAGIDDLPLVTRQRQAQLTVAPVGVVNNQYAGLLQARDENLMLDELDNFHRRCFRTFKDTRWDSPWRAPQPEQR
jgi:hypothetical protein